MSNLSESDVEELGRELDAIQSEVKASLGERDRRYIERLIAIQRGLALAARGVMFCSLALAPLGAPSFVVLGVGAVMLAVAKILENMEIGHNVMHGQWDWMHDPDISSATWEWDAVCPSDQWKHSHNVVHHRWTNVLGKDRDVGYEILRVTDEQPWYPAAIFQPVYSALLALFFEYGVAMHDVDIKKPVRESRHLLRGIGKKILRQWAKDYLLWPLLAGPFFPRILVANMVANLIRNVWAYMIIFCGHFPDGVQTFTEEEVKGETRGRFCLRQILGSCNIEGGRLFHVMSGNLSHQIEHHLFPDMPSNRYPEVAPRVRALCEKYGVPYNSGSLTRQFGTTTRKIWRLALPTAPRPSPPATAT
jgi:linoleoyl-CoA desaturase